MVTLAARGGERGPAESGRSPALQSKQWRGDPTSRSYACADGRAPPPAGPGLRGNAAGWSGSQRRWGPTCCSKGQEERRTWRQAVPPALMSPKRPNPQGTARHQDRTSTVTFGTVQVSAGCNPLCTGGSQDVTPKSRRPWPHTVVPGLILGEGALFSVTGVTHASVRVRGLHV